MTATVKALPMYKISDIPDSLRQLANRIEHGEVGAVRVVVAIEPNRGIVTYTCFGAEPFTYAHSVGLLEAAKKEILKCVE